ncbi:MAG: hypothetical protein IPL61_35440 [Myxococcales bacterium]|nr:hypothetical protein [Myxococcales bacterium]
MRRVFLLSVACVLGAPGLHSARADEVSDQPTDPLPARRRTASAATIFRGPFRSPRLFAMPVADVVGAFQLSLSGDASLLQEPGILTSAGVAAIGFGDVAQIEYRHTTAVGIGRLTAPIPAVGVQLQAPFRERPWVPAVAIAFRLGVPRRETVSGEPVDESVTDLYLVTRLRMRGPLTGLTVHTGARVSSAKIARPGLGPDGERQRVMVLPALGLDLQATDVTRAIAEISLAPQFRFDPDVDAAPRVDYGLLGRVGVRWAALPAVVLDDSVGYQLEVGRGQPDDGLDASVQWDIRLGGEVFVPWGAIACRVTGGFCE